MGFVGRTALVAGIIASAALPAMAQQAPRIRQIIVQGTQRIEIETVKSYMAIAEGDPYDSERVDRSLKTLYNTGLFADVTIRQEGDTLVVRVVENPIINRLAFEGNKRIKEDQLKSEVQLRPRTVYSRTKVLADVKRILDLYRRQGRFAATVDPKIIQLEQNRVDLVFEINEGPPAYVKRINFVGNHFYDEGKLRETIRTKEERWYRFLSSDDTYDPDRLTYDRELLRRFYLKHGFADFRVTSAVAELTPDREGFFITFTIDEGKRYKFGTSDIKAQLKDLKVDELRPLLVSKPGDWYNGDQVEKIVQNLTDAAGSRGFAFVDVRPEVKRNPEKRTVDIVYNIKEGPRVYVDRIDITGNSRTLDKVIRREMALVEGDAFNTAKIRLSQQRIRDLDFFEKANVTNVPSESAPDRTTVKVDVTEKSTGDLSFGVGWSSVVGPLAQVSMQERNLLGTAQNVRATVAFGTLEQDLSLSYTQPYLFDRRLVGGVDLFSTKRDLQYEAGYNYETNGGALRLGYQLSDNLSQGWKYTLKEDKVDGVLPGSSLYIVDQEGIAILSSVEHDMAYDRRDSKVDPTEGYVVHMSNEYAGLGGNEYFVRNNLGGNQYFPVAEQVVLMLSANGGYIYSLNGDPVRITERYFLGGDTLRGFYDMGVAPRDDATQDAIGGIWQYYGTAQLQFPLGLPEEYGVGGRLFSDFGAIGPTPDSSQGLVDQSLAPRVSIGTGISWKSPMGPIAIDVAYPIIRQPFDKIEILHFNMGTRF
ncbi:MAG: outer membrane protein assembly factor BamA [Magnetospirillum sp.]|nr:outer membrane protein assembly factor BamA [Magnetospirillum sp.]